MGELSPWHWVIVFLAFALLFGAKRLPDAARGLGRSMRIFKAEMSAAADGEPGTAAPRPDATPTNHTPTDTPTVAGVDAASASRNQS